jgi:hypothetical protein
MRPAISEFSYGYAVTESLIRDSAGSITEAPRFPSLRDEGKSEGYDLFLPLAGFPLYVQFKVCDYMRGDPRAREVRAGCFTGPFFRMHLRSRKRSTQHDLLLAWERKGNAVFYVGSALPSLGHFNQAYRTGTVLTTSAYFQPVAIGDIRDDDEHHVAFAPPQTGFVLCSQPKPFHTSVDYAAFQRDLATRLDLSQRSLEAHLRRDRNFLRELIFQGTLFAQQDRDHLDQLLDELHDDAARVTYMAQTYLGCAVFFVARRQRR